MRKVAWHYANEDMHSGFRGCLGEGRKEGRNLDKWRRKGKGRSSKVSRHGEKVEAILKGLNSNSEFSCKGK